MKNAEETGENTFRETPSDLPLSKRRRFQMLLTPVGFVFAPLLSVYVTNQFQVSASDLLRPALIVSLISALLGAFAYRLLKRDLTRATVLLSGLFFLFFGFDALQRMVDWFVENFVLLFWDSAVDWNIRVLTLCVWVLLCFSIIVVGTRAKRSRLVSFITPLSAVSVTLLGFQIAALLRTPAPGMEPFVAPVSGSRDIAGNGEAARPSVTAASSGRAKPDVYFIVLDAYSRQDKLKKYFDFDNEGFLHKLEERGFYIARQGRANYNQTALCLAACLNLEYVPQLFRANEVPSVLGVEQMTERINRSRVAAFLRAEGYRFVSIPTGTPLTSTPSADLILDAPPLTHKPPVSQLEGLILDTTPLVFLPRPDTRLYEEHRQRIRSAFENLPRAARLSSPKFVFAHILAPHPPFVFEAKGDTKTLPDRPFTLGDGTDFTRRSAREQYRQQYPPQVQYVNENILVAIDGILAAARERHAPTPLIVLIGDHGSRMMLDWDNIDKTDLQEPFGNLEAVLLPPGDAARVLYPGISPVNLFRTLLTHYFEADYPLLPDRSFYSTLQYPYQFTDVTDRS